MRRGTIALLILSSLLNSVLCASAFLFSQFATNPGMQDVTMRIGFYVLNLISMTALAGTIAPWIFASRKRNRGALVFAIAPAAMTCLAIVSFLTLDSWLRRTFSGRAIAPVAISQLTYAAAACDVNCVMPEWSGPHQS
ncbi:MAG: hypothetical protein ACR2O4_01025 [Hyphomicrobiaceae bacterium]